LDKDACEVLLGGKTDAEKAAVDYDKPVIAVLPFTDLSRKGTPIHLLDGFSDELSTLLALFDDIRLTFL
jgi:TolB-like protein